jgi:uncharacterized protein (DUF433 family)
MNRITINPEQCGGQPCLRGMRIRVKDVLDMLAADAKPEEILADFPDLEAADIEACLAYAAAGKPTAALTVEELHRRVARANREDFIAFLDASPDAPPIEGDELR